MNFVFQNNASSITEEKSSTRGMMSRDRFDLIKKLALIFYKATQQRSLRRQLHSIVKSIKEQRRFRPQIYLVTSQFHLKALRSRDWTSSLEQVASALQIFSEMATQIVLAIQVTISGNKNFSKPFEILFFRDQASDMAGNAASMAGSALSAGWNAFNKIKDNYS